MLLQVLSNPVRSPATSPSFLRRARFARPLVGLVTLIATVALASSVSAQGKPLGTDLEVYLEIPGLKGEVAVKGFEGHIAVGSFSWGLSNAISWGGGGGGSVGKPNFGDLALTKAFDSTSPELFFRAASGQFTPKVSLRVVRTVGGTREVYMTLELENVLISSMSLSGSGGTGDASAFESIALAFAKITMIHRAPNGTLTERSWNIATNTSK